MVTDVDRLISLEDRLIRGNFVAIATAGDLSAGINQEVLDAVNVDVEGIAASVHKRVLSDLIFTFLKNRFPDNFAEIASCCFNIDVFSCEELAVTELSQIPQICECLHADYLNSQFSITLSRNKIRSKSKARRVELGAVYTRPHIAAQIVDGALSVSDRPLYASKILDFACGTGRFFDCIISRFDDKKQAVLNNVYALDIDGMALSVTKLKALAHFDAISLGECEVLNRHIAQKNGLLKCDSFFPEPDSVGPDDFNGLAEGGFDIIVSNPPYLVLKPNKSKGGVADADKVQKQVNYFRSCGYYTLSIEGMLNLYQLSVERMLQMLRPRGVLGVICPSTLFGDISVAKLRRHLLLENKVHSIRFYAEKTSLFENVSQATNIFILEKGGQTDKIQITEESDSFDVGISLVQELFPAHLEIPAIKLAEWNILRKLSDFPKLKDFSEIRNRRGELDLTLCKKFITTSATPYRLVRGNMIGNGCIKDINGEFVSDAFITTKSADYMAYDFGHKRLICQQISNGGQKKRLRFVFCGEGDVLGNSCNYISAEESILKKLFLILNSSILDWRFKITSSNNHINNYELGELPLADLSKVDSARSFNTQKELDAYVGSLYGLSAEEIEMITSYE